MTADAAGMVYVNVQTDPGKIAVIDTKALAVKSTWSLSGCANPTGLAFDAVHRRLFSVCENEVMAVTDSLSGKQVARVMIAEARTARRSTPISAWYSVRTGWTVH